jgi:ATP-dependent phosphofructokinase / diphosphate-dependent phosphofructokinase
MRQTIVIAQGGGPTAVINQTLAGAALEARKAGMTVLGSLHGVRGIRDNRYVDLTSIPEVQLMAIAGTPSAALGSTRDKPDQAYCNAVLKGLQTVGADAFVYIGGNDTAGTQAILADAAGGAMTFVHAPKTIDNDLEANDHTPGFISAGAFVAGAFLSIDLDFRALPGIYVGIVMGRHAGFLTAAASAWRLDEEAGPHLLYVPERAFDHARFIDDVKRTMDRHKRCTIAVSEGVSTADGRALVESLVPPDKIERDEHGNLQLGGTDLASAFGRMLAEGLPGKRIRVDTFGFMPRGNIATISAVDQQEAFEAGAFAVRAISEGSTSVALQFDGQRMIMKKVPLGSVAGKTRLMPDNFLHLEENKLSETGIAYLRRLLPQKFTVARPFVG